MKLVVNRCHGSFGLSDAAYERMIELGIEAVEYTRDKSWNDKKVIFDNRIASGSCTLFNGCNYWDAWTLHHENRSDKILVQAVEELGDKASNLLSDLVVVEVPDDVEFFIDDYDGFETVRENHRTW